jgi:hypothetical protein
MGLTPFGGEELNSISEREELLDLLQGVQPVFS